MKWSEMKCRYTTLWNTNIQQLRDSLKQIVGLIVISDVWKQIFHKAV